MQLDCWQPRFGNASISGKRLVYAALPLVAALITGSSVTAQETAGNSIRLNARIDPAEVTRIQYDLRIRGRIVTPSESGQTELDLDSVARFDFQQRQFLPAVSGPFGLRAWRQFQVAESSTTVAKDHKTSVRLPTSHRLLQVFGSDSAMNHLSPDVRITRKQVDLLQMPCDPIVVNALLPERELTSATEKWNTDDWVLPLLFGMDAAVSQSATCQISTLTDTTATITCDLKADGAVNGSSSQVSVRGTLTFDRQAQRVSGFRATLTEKRSPGTVSPGLDVVAEISWSQEAGHENSAAIPAALTETAPTEAQLLLTLVTPWRLTLLHNREWHLFHETAELVMLRLLQNGQLIGQCNLSPSIVVPAGEFTPEDKFLADVQQSLSSRNVTIQESRVDADVNGWRVHSVQARTAAQPSSIQWHYHLCTHPGGQQFLLIFSHTEEQKSVFEPERQALLRSLTLHPVPTRGRIPLPK